MHVIIQRRKKTTKLKWGVNWKGTGGLLRKGEALDGQKERDALSRHRIHVYPGEKQKKKSGNASI